MSPVSQQRLFKTPLVWVRSWVECGQATRNPTPSLRRQDFLEADLVDQVLAAEVGEVRALGLVGQGGAEPLGHGSI